MCCIHVTHLIVCTSATSVVCQALWDVSIISSQYIVVEKMENSQCPFKIKVPVPERITIQHITKGRAF